jgi:hypothetical protein
MTNCILCQRPLSETTAPNLYLHEVAEDCLVRVADHHGISLDDGFVVDGEDIFPRAAEPEFDERVIILPTWKPIEEVMGEIFADLGLDRLGGRSTGSGWSSVSLFQKCRYAWKKNYLVEKTEDKTFMGEILPLAVGILVHTYLALHYQRMLVADYPLTADDVNQRVREAGCNPEVFLEAWRLFSAYRLFYKNEVIVPLAIEANYVDPRTNDSCRYDLVAYFPDEVPGRLPGTYVVEHKTASRFDQNTLEAWPGDGEILGQINAWQRLHLDKRFGPLRGVLVNLIGKQKMPEFHRTIAAPTSFAIEQHRADLRQTNAEIQLAKTTGVFPRSRANCIHRFGRCQFWDHCNLGED